MEKGAIDKAASSLSEAVAKADIVFIAVPVMEIVPLIKQIKEHLKPGVLVTDVGSTKAKIVDDMKALLNGSGINFIGGHPMTGSEAAGIEGANANFFNNCFYVLTPTKDTELKHYEMLHALLTMIKAKVIALDPENHDKMMSKISHLPHAIAASLVNYTNMDEIEKSNLMLLSAGGFRDMTRIASSNSKVWSDIFLTNKKFIIEAIDGFIESLVSLKKNIEEQNTGDIVRFLDKARDSRSAITGEAAVDLQKMRYVQVFIPDEPGAVSNVTVAIGSKGINIEDLELIHFVEGQEAVLKCLIYGHEKAIEAAKEIKKLGYEVQIVTGNAV